MTHPFTFLVDETTDKSNKCLMILIVLFIDTDEVIMSDVLHIENVSSGTTAEELFSVIERVILKPYGKSMNIAGGGHDSPNVYAGKKKSVDVLIKV